MDLRTTSLIWREVNRKNQKYFLKKYVDNGLFAIEAIGSEPLSEIVLLHTNLETRVSLQDTSVLFYAEKLNGVVLTGDKRLRQCAIERGVETHGLLWVLDQIVARGAMLPEVVADRLTKILDHGKSRFPVKDCEVRIKKW